MILVDSSIWDAAQNKKDKNHELAKKILQEVGEGAYGDLLVTDYIIDEILTWVNERLNHSTAVELSQKFFSDSQIEIEKIDWATIHRACDLFAEKDFLSFTDATTGIVMDARGIGKISTFDSDFEKLGFETIGVD